MNNIIKDYHNINSRMIRDTDVISIFTFLTVNPSVKYKEVATEVAMFFVEGNNVIQIIAHAQSTYNDILYSAQEAELVIDPKNVIIKQVRKDRLNTQRLKSKDVLIVSDNNTVNYLQGVRKELEKTEFVSLVGSINE
jgi:hypothetical protein